MRNAMRIVSSPPLALCFQLPAHERSSIVKVSVGWLNASSSAYRAKEGITGYAHLSRCAVSYKEWGDGPPLVLVPGLAGGYELLGPLARLLAADFRVISYELRGEN